jgi:hypothetical protein
VADPVISSITFSPTVPTNGYVKGTVVTVTMTYSDADSQAEAVGTVTGTVRDSAGREGTFETQVKFAAYSDINPLGVSLRISPTRPVETLEVTPTRAVFRFIA